MVMRSMNPSEVTNFIIHSAGLVAAPAASQS
jgi:hypothetical protein